MFVPFSSLQSTARIWIFQSNRPFTAEDLKILEERLRAFTETWAVHGAPLPTSYRVDFNQFIILGADETFQSASGCSIDSAVRAVKDVGASLGVDLFDRSRVAFLQDDKVKIVPLSALKQNFESGMLTGSTLTFNNLVETKAALEEQWLVPAAETWVRRYIPDVLAKVK